VAIAKRLDDRRKEVLESLRQQGKVLQYDEEVEAVVVQGDGKAVLKRNRLEVISFSSVVHKAPFRKGTLFVCEPLAGGREVREDRSAGAL